MFKPILAGIVAGGAFCVSFILGLFGRTPILVTFLRALAFSGCFFGIVAGIYFLYNKFLLPVEPDDKEPEDSDLSGHNIDYTLGDDNEWLDSLDYDGNASENTSEISESDAEGSDVPNGTEPGVLNVFENKPETAVSERSPEVLAQNNDSGYSIGGDSLLPREKAGAFFGDGYDMNMSAFIPGIPGIEGGDYSQGAAAQTSSDSGMNEGTVDMSVERDARKLDLGFDVDGKKMAGAIQTLLKKD
ncbi:MAG: hypothetical protein LBB47_04560 [Spirochaetaceae bacterium]|nr:hypothetical protein [Spirochaetaceae bacterium]